MAVGLAAHVKGLLGWRRLFGRRPALPAPDPLLAPPAPIRSAADLETAPMQQAWLLLEKKRGERRFLARTDIDPGDLKPILPSVGLVEVHYEPLRFRIRLAGTDWRRSVGFEATGMWLDQWPNPVQRQVLENGWTTIVREGRAGRARRNTVVEGVMLHYEAVFIPLAADGQTIDMVLVMSAPWPSDSAPTVFAP